ncbi:MAG: hypothetical protein HY906_06685 [Deltaproteobacteria bacterium]|nr:hypothetical protein [Deltaproteobacteria bacterium]
MRRLLRLLGLAAALALGAAVLGCPFFHGSYPPSTNECSKSSDCLMGETCGDAGTCTPAPATDAGTDDGGPTDGGSHAG